MDALIIGLLAGALVSFGGRWWLLGRAITDARGQTLALSAMLASALVAAAAAAWLGASIAAQVRGPGLLLFFALSLLLAGASALWPLRQVAPRLLASARGPASAFILLLAAQLGESAPFIILATAAWTLDPLMAGIGGAMGLVVAAASTALLTPSELEALPVRTIRHFTGGLALLLGLWLALTALGFV